MFTKLTEFLDGLLELGVPGFDCIVYHSGVCIYRHMNGYSDYENKIKINGKEKYNIYSCSKPITCVAALQLYEQGYFKMDDVLSDFMPEFETMHRMTDTGTKKVKSKIKIKDLFCMTAGFSYDLNSQQLQIARVQTDGRCETRKTMEYLAKEPLLFEPGEKFEYSLCHDVLAALVEVISGEKYSDYVKKHIFQPLGMNDSTFHMSDEEMDMIAEQYIFNAESKTLINCGKHNYFNLGTAYDSGGAGCISTVEDYIRFLEALRIGGTFIKSETVDFMSTNYLSDEQLRTFVYQELGYGYGLGVRCPRDRVKTDFGWDGAAGSYLAVDKENKISVFYAQHVLGSGAPELIRRQLFDIVKEEIINNQKT